MEWKERNVLRFLSNYKTTTRNVGVFWTNLKRKTLALASWIVHLRLFGSNKKLVPCPVEVTWVTRVPIRENPWVFSKYQKITWHLQNTFFKSRICMLSFWARMLIYFVQNWRSGFPKFASGEVENWRQTKLKRLFVFTILKQFSSSDVYDRSADGIHIF